MCLLRDHMFVQMHTWACVPVPTSLNIFIQVVLVPQLCPILFDTMDYSLPGSSVNRILQARILEWVAISFSRGSS